MSSPRRLPKKKPETPAKAEIAEDLPVLEPIADDLPTLEPVAAEPTGPVRVTCQPAGEPGFDVLLAVEVAAMDKKDVPAAVQGPLEQAAGANAVALRFHRVVVRFGGEAMVGSAIKELVAKLLQPHKPARVVVRRGFGDEQVHEGAPPALPIEAKTDGGTTKVTVGTAGLELLDLAALLPKEVAQLATTAKGRRFTFVFQGGAKPDAALREQIGKALRDAGALRAAVGERVLFDLELANRVLVAAGDPVVVTVDPADAATTQEALHMVLPGQLAAFAGKSVRVHFRAPVGDTERALCIDFVRKGGASRIEVGDGKADGEVVWPNLLELVLGAEPIVRVVANGRGRAAVLKAFAAEVGEQAAAVGKGTVVVDWPAGFAVDGEVEALLQKGFGGAKAVFVTVAGDARERMVPSPLQAGVAGEVSTVTLDTDAGKPAELIRAIERRLPGIAAGLRGKAVRVKFAGAAAPSRTLLRTLCGGIEAAGCARLEVEDRGQVDVLLPPLLTISKSPQGVRLAAIVGGREPAQVVSAMQRELDAAELAKGALVTVAQSSVTDALVAALVARGVGRVVVDGQALVQVHPPLFAAPKAGVGTVVVAATPIDDAAMLGRMLDRELPGLLPKLAGTTPVVIVWPGAGDPPQGVVATLVERLVAGQVAEVHLDSGNGQAFQVHPPVPVLELEPVVESVVESVPAAPPPPPAAVVPATGKPVAAPVPMVMPAGGNRLAVVQRGDTATPPFVVLAVTAGDDEANVTAVRSELEAHLPRFRGRAVLLVPCADGADVPVRRPGALVAMLGSVLSTAAAATLVFRGPDAGGRPHFEVLHSTVRALRKGRAIADPRARLVTLG